MDADAKRTLAQVRLRLAWGDLSAARSLTWQKPRLLGRVAYHCQKAAEHALKGFLTYFDGLVVGPHDVDRLIDKAVRIEPVFEIWRSSGKRLNALATAYRYCCYPGGANQPGPEDIEAALGDAEAIYKRVLSYLPREVHPES